MRLGPGISPHPSPFTSLQLPTGWGEPGTLALPGGKFPTSLRLMNPPDAAVAVPGWGDGLPVLRVMLHVYPSAARLWREAPAGINLQ